MKSDGIPRVNFDDGRAFPIYPKPVAKHAALVRVPMTDDGFEVPTLIKPEWGGIQNFLGDYYAIIRADGVVRYGSARLQWEAMHTRLAPAYWVKTAVPLAYRATEVCRVVTYVLDQAGDTTREVSCRLEPNDWIVKQPGGEVQHITESKYREAYFSQAEAEALGLPAMSAEEFAAWALAEARPFVPVVRRPA